MDSIAPRSMDVLMRFPTAWHGKEMVSSRRLRVVIDADRVHIFEKHGLVLDIRFELSPWLFLRRFLGPLLGWVVALTTTDADADFLAVVPANRSDVWILSATRSGPVVRGAVVCRRRLEVANPAIYYLLPFKDFYLRPSPSRAAEVFDVLVDRVNGLGLPSDFPIFSSPHVARRLLAVIHPAELWFLTFPFDYFIRSEGFGRLSRYREIEWIVSGKTPLRNGLERALIAEELSDVETVLSHSFFIINTYPIHLVSEDAARCTIGTNLVVRVLSLLQDLEVQTTKGPRSLSLRWTLNPSRSQLFHILCDPSCRYVFADFHVENGAWLLGNDGSTAGERFRPSVDLNLRHVRLLRIFHCNSAFDPYRPEELNDSITQRLLRAGAFRVEGSLMKEHYTDFLRSLLRFFFRDAGLKPLIIGKLLECGHDPSELLRRASTFSGDL